MKRKFWLMCAAVCVLVCLGAWLALSASRGHPAAHRMAANEVLPVQVHGSFVTMAAADPHDEISWQVLQNVLAGNGILVRGPDGMGDVTFGVPVEDAARAEELLRGVEDLSAHLTWTRWGGPNESPGGRRSVFEVRKPYADALHDVAYPDGSVIGRALRDQRVRERVDSGMSMVRWIGIEERDFVRRDLSRVKASAVVVQLSSSAVGGNAESLAARVYLTMMSN